jgi:hypothetical protein
MSMFAPILGILLATLLAGCASQGPVRSLAAAANNSAAVEQDRDGTVTLRSHQTHVVSVLPAGGRFSSDVWGLPAFYVIVTNGGKENVTLKPADISAYAGDRRVAVPTPAALQDRLDREQAAADPRPSFPIVRDASQPADVRAHPGPLVPKVQPYSAPDFKVPRRLTEEALQPQTIRPGQVGGGRITLEGEDILSGLPLKIVVTVAGEKHEFLFEVQY